MDFTDLKRECARNSIERATRLLRAIGDDESAEMLEEVLERTF